MALAPWSGVGALTQQVARHVGSGCGGVVRRMETIECMGGGCVVSPVRRWPTADGVVTPMWLA